ncbi:hypothetical protein BDV19DRAFT_386930 [Aspergillus venezuelensis]
MSGVEIALGVMGAADVRYRYGRSLIETYKAIQIADTDFQEKSLIVEAIWTKISIQLDELKRVWELLDPRYQRLQESILPALTRKLESATLQLSKIETKYNKNDKLLRSFRYRSKYVIAVKSNLVNTLTKDVRILASRLRNVNPLEFHLLKCFGVVKTREDGNNTKSFNFIFTIPKDLSNPLTKQLAISVSFVHTLGFVHKNIRPESILMLNDSTSGPSLFLVGFKSFRMADGKTLRLGDTSWETNLYRHPTRQWLPEADYVMQHDIYSLGVCLLEIGLGESFVNYEDDGALSASPISDNFADLRSAGSVKNRLVALAGEYLPRKMGNMYTHVVLNCLTCIDEDNEDFGDESEFVGDDGTLIGVAYIEKILFQLNTISM